jgi:hypothetical protein
MLPIGSVGMSIRLTNVRRSVRFGIHRRLDVEQQYTGWPDRLYLTGTDVMPTPSASCATANAVNSAVSCSGSTSFFTSAMSSGCRYATAKASAAPRAIARALSCNNLQLSERMLVWRMPEEGRRAARRFLSQPVDGIPGGFQKSQNLSPGPVGISF